MTPSNTLSSATLVRCSALVSALAFAGLAQAQLAIQSVTASVQGGSEVVRIQTSEPLAQVPAGFATQAPARIALDFPGAKNALGRSAIDLNQGNLRSAMVVEAGDRTRVVLNLNQPSPYRTRIDGNALIVQLDSAAAPAAAAVAPVAAPVVAAAATAGADAVAPLSQIDFRRGTDNTGRVVVQLGSRETGVDIRTQGKNLLVEFTRTALPEGLRRRLDVTDFGTPVQAITTTQVGDRVRMLVEPVGNWEHSAYQSDNQFVLEVREIKVDPGKLTPGPGYSGEKLTLNFQNIEVRALLQVIADFTDFNIITSDTVGGNVTLRLKDVPWDQAMDIILQAKGLGMRKTGNVIWVAPREEILAKEKAELEAQQQIRTLEPVRTQSFRLNFAKAEDVAKQLTTAVGTGESAVRLLSRQGSVFAETRTNQIFVTDIGSKLEEIQELIKKVDVPVKQVLIEARFVEATDDFSKSLGVRFGGRIVGSNASATVGSLSNRLNGSTAAPSGPTGGFEVIPTGTATDDGGLFGISLFNSAATRLLALEIAANEGDTKLKTIASPRVVTADQKEAKIEDGQKIPYRSVDDAGNTTTEFLDAVLSLKVTPQITPDGDVIMALDLRKDRAVIGGQEGAVETKTIQTQALVENGGTIVIGGIYIQEDTNSLQKVPGLGDLPGIGNLFRSRTTTSTKRELLVFITPRVLSEGSSLTSRR